MPKSINGTQTPSGKRSGAKHWPALRVANYLPKDGWLLEFGASDRAYNPAAHPEVLAELAKLKDGDETPAITFARAWGLPEPGGKDPWDSERPKDYSRGSPLSFVWRHARNARLILHLLLYRQTKDEQGLTDFLRGQTSGVTTQTNAVRYAAGLGERAFELSGNPVTDSEALIREIINENSGPDEAATATLLATSPRRVLRVAYRLLPAVYGHAAMTTVSGSVSRCEDETCRQIFVKTDMRQRYCPPGSPWQGVESLCAFRARKRRERERLAQGGALPDEGGEG